MAVLSTSVRAITRNSQMVGNPSLASGSAGIYLLGLFSSNGECTPVLFAPCSGSR